MSQTDAEAKMAGSYPFGTKGLRLQIQKCKPVRRRVFNGTDKTCRSPKKPRNPDAIPRTPRAPRKRYEYPEPLSPISELSGPISWVVGAGGFGTLQVLPKEVRQAIYGYAFEIDRPVTVKECCGPETTRRERAVCRKHGIGSELGAGHFNVVQISKSIREEAAWVIFSYGSLNIDASRSINTYLDGRRLTTLRRLGDSKLNKEKTALWAAAARFRFVNIHVPGDVLRYGHPTTTTDRLLQIVCWLCKRWEDQCKACGAEPSAKSFVTIELGSIFHEVLPFNIVWLPAMYDDWLCEWETDHYPGEEEPDYQQIAAESAHNLQRLASMIGMHQDYAQWRVLANTELEEKDEGGANSLHNFQVNCARNGVDFEHSI